MLKEKKSRISKRPEPYYKCLRKEYEELGSNLSFPLFKGYGDTQYKVLRDMDDEYLANRIKYTYNELETCMNINTTLYEVFLYILESEMSNRIRNHKLLKIKRLIENGNC